jgi:uncharacterized membrane protein
MSEKPINPKTLKVFQDINASGGSVENHMLGGCLIVLLVGVVIFVVAMSVCNTVKKDPLGCDSTYQKTGEIPPECRSR